MHAYTHPLFKAVAVVHVAVVLALRMSGFICRSARTGAGCLQSWSQENEKNYARCVFLLDVLLVPSSLCLGIPNWTWPAEITSIYLILSWHMLYDVR